MIVNSTFLIKCAEHRVLNGTRAFGKYTIFVIFSVYDIPNQLQHWNLSSVSVTI